MDAAVKSEYVEAEVKIKEETSPVSYSSRGTEHKDEAVELPFHFIETQNIKPEYSRESSLSTEEYDVSMAPETVLTVEEQDYFHGVSNTGNDHGKFFESGNKPYVCTVCNREFSRKSGLSIHMLLHTGEKPFSCHVCSRKFSDKSNLRKHQVIHTGEKLFSCDICKKSFSRKTRLRSHRIIHTGEKPFSCDVCTKAFTLSCSLKRHQLIHKGERKFSCDDCTKAFVQRGDLMKHIKRMHTRKKLG